MWSNSPWSDSYESFWTTDLSIIVGDQGISLDLRQWISEGLMTFFFLVVGLEARREFDTGVFRERRRIALPVVAAISGMAVAVAIYLAFNAGGDGAHGWGRRCPRTPPSLSVCWHSWLREPRVFACGC